MGRPGSDVGHFRSEASQRETVLIPGWVNQIHQRVLEATVVSRQMVFISSLCLVMTCVLFASCSLIMS